MEAKKMSLCGHSILDLRSDVPLAVDGVLVGTRDGFTHDETYPSPPNGSPASGDRNQLPHFSPQLFGDFPRLPTPPESHSTTSDPREPPQHCSVSAVDRFPSPGAPAAVRQFGRAQPVVAISLRKQGRSPTPSSISVSTDHVKPPQSKNSSVDSRLLVEYHKNLPTGNLKLSMQHTLDPLSLGSFSSSDEPPSNEGPADAGNSLIHFHAVSPKWNERVQNLSRASRNEFESLSTNALVDYCCRAHSIMVLLAECVSGKQLLDAPADTRGRPANSATSREVSHDARRSFHVSAIEHDSGGLAGTSVSQPVLASGSVNASMFFSAQMGASTTQSIQSQIFEPVHETRVAVKTKDDLGVKMINNFLLMDTLGQGACGKVKLGYNVDKGQSVAIKVVRRAAGRNHMSGQAARARVDALHREIAVMKKLRHKNIVSLYEVIDDPEAEKLYLVMQYVDDGPIGRMKPDGTCTTRPPDEVAMYGRQVCAGLEYLHSKGIVHRDIKPENILVSSNKQAYLADFGVSEIFAPEQSGAVRGHKGTPLFMAPEVWQARKNAGSIPSQPAATMPSCDAGEYPAPEREADDDADDDVDGFALDIWALGVTFYMLLFGRPPYPDVSVLQGSASCVPRLTFPDSPSSPVLPEWKSLLLRMLDAQPYKRPQAPVVRQAVKKIEKRSIVVPPLPPTKPGSKKRSHSVAILDADVDSAFTAIQCNRALRRGTEGSFLAILNSLATANESDGHVPGASPRAAEQRVSSLFQPLVLRGMSNGALPRGSLSSTRCPPANDDNNDVDDSTVVSPSSSRAPGIPSPPTGAKPNAQSHRSRESSAHPLVELEDMWVL